MSHDTEDIRHHVQVYLRVFAALMVFTVITVAISYMHLMVPLAIAVALVIATIKGSMVAAYFMHLSNEKKVIYAALLLAAAFWVVLMALPTLAYLGAHGAHTGVFGHVTEAVPPPVH